MLTRIDNPDTMQIMIVSANSTAWIGPTIGPCCYEVGEEVAGQFPAEAVVPGPAGRPHLDLVAAARLQLGSAGEVRTVADCTRCEGERLYSFRREGRGVGRNVAFIWRRTAPAPLADPARTPGAGRRPR